MMSRAAQTYLAGHMRPAGRVLEAPGLERPIQILSLSIKFGGVEVFVMYMKTCVQRLPSGPKKVVRW